MNIWDVLILSGVAGILTAGFRGFRAIRKKGRDCNGSCRGCSSGDCPYKR